MIVIVIDFACKEKKNFPLTSFTVNNDIKFIKKVEEIALNCGYKPIELSLG
jgi:hypothetical protein